MPLGLWELGEVSLEKEMRRVGLLVIKYKDKETPEKCVLRVRVIGISLPTARGIQYQNTPFPVPSSHFLSLLFLEISLDKIWTDSAQLAWPGKVASWCLVSFSVVILSFYKIHLEREGPRSSLGIAVEHITASCFLGNLVLEAVVCLWSPDFALSFTLITAFPWDSLAAYWRIDPRRHWVEAVAETPGFHASTGIAPNLIIQVHSLWSTIEAEEGPILEWVLQICSDLYLLLVCDPR